MMPLGYITIPLAFLFMLAAYAYIKHAADAESKGSDSDDTAH